jgi:mono/diheme cytochrome c family protein
MIRRMLRRAGVALGAVIAALVGYVVYVAVTGIPRYTPRPPDLRVDVTPERVARGRTIVTLLCADCHEDHATKSLTGHVMAEIPAELGVVVSTNITRDPEDGIGRWTDGDLAYLLRTGVRRDGQYLPPYMVKLPHMSDEDLASIIAFLRSDDPIVAPARVAPPGRTQPTLLTKFLTHTVMKPLPYPSRPIAAPARTDRVAFGRYLVFAYDCFSCHSADLKTANAMEPEKTNRYLGGGAELLDGNGDVIVGSNITPDEETGIGKWSEADFVRAVKSGFRPDGQVLRSPMAPRSAFDDDEVASIYAYLRTVPRIHHSVVRRVAPAPQEDDPGHRAYVQYGCVACHGERGVGLGGAADLRRSCERYPTDAALRAYIEDAPSKKPGTAMPGWKGVVREDDWAPLLRRVRGLCAGARVASPASSS